MSSAERDGTAMAAQITMRRRSRAEALVTEAQNPSIITAAARERPPGAARKRQQQLDREHRTS